MDTDGNSKNKNLLEEYILLLKENSELQKEFVDCLLDKQEELENENRKLKEKIKELISKKA